MPATPCAPPDVWPITAVPAPLGARIGPPGSGATARRFTLADDGGRGTPACIVALPVQRIATDDGERWGVVVDGTPHWPVEAAHVRRAARFHAVVPGGQRPALYEGVIEPDAAAAAWLMLLVYSQCGAIGAAGRVVDGWYSQPVHFDGVAGLSRTGQTFGEMDAEARGALTRGFGVAPSPAIAAPQTRAAIVPLPSPDAFIERVVAAICASIVLRFERATTASLRQAVVEVPARPRQRATVPEPAVVFALASCQYAAGLLDRAPPFASAHAGPAQASWQRLAARLDAATAVGTDGAASGPAPAFIVLAGDQVYVDATAGLFDPRLLDDRYRAPYENLYGGRHVQDVLRRLPAQMLIDDHEIDDNWAPRFGEAVAPTADPRALPPASRNTQLMLRGVAAYRAQQRGLRADGPNPFTLWQTAPLGGFDFFLGDTRVHRDPRGTGTLATAQIMDAAQLQRLLGWMSTPSPAPGAPRPRFVATPSMLLPRRLATSESPAAALRSDAWDGYPATLHAVLGHICDARLGHVVFLSGDEHLSCIATVTLARADRADEAPVTFHSIHSSALYAPYPFANATAHDFAADDAFDFRIGDGATAVHYHCTVATVFAPGDGFALLRVAQDAAGWTLEVEFDRARSHATAPAPHRTTLALGG